MKILPALPPPPPLRSSPAPPPAPARPPSLQGNADVYTIKPQDGTNPAITVTLTPLVRTPAACYRQPGAVLECRAAEALVHPAVAHAAHTASSMEHAVQPPRHASRCKCLPHWLGGLFRWAASPRAASWHLQDGDGDADLYCSKGTLNPSPDTADFSSGARVCACLF